MKKRVIKVSIGSDGSFKFETRAIDLDRIKEQAEALLEKGEKIMAIEYSIFDTLG